MLKIPITKAKVQIIVAVDDFLGIGYRGGLPWHNPRDLGEFKRQTTNNVVVMGSRTWMSLPKKPLPNRINIILSKDKQFTEDIYKEYDGKAHVFDSIDSLMNGYVVCNNVLNGSKKMFIIGGAEVYRAAMYFEIVDQIILTHIKGTFPADTYFPPIPHTDKYTWTKSYPTRFKGAERIIYRKDYL